MGIYAIQFFLNVQTVWSSSPFKYRNAKNLFIMLDAWINELFGGLKPHQLLELLEHLLKWDH